MTTPRSSSPPPNSPEQLCGDPASSIEVRGLNKDFKLRRGPRRSVLHAVVDANIVIGAGRTVALVGESGSGKSTIARIVAKLETPTSGEVLLDGERTPVRGAALSGYRRQVQMVFQDPFASLNPYHTIRHHIERPLRLHKVVPSDQVENEVLALLERVRLEKALVDRRPHELSGGQRQRVAIARALASRPSLLIADEPVSMLDVSIRLGVLNLLADLQRESNLGVLYITHDLATARHFSDRIMVLHHGTVVEEGPADEVILNPQHPYTRSLRDASPDPDKHFAPIAPAPAGDWAPSREGDQA